jgi:hypothetical protein
VGVKNVGKAASSEQGQSGGGGLVWVVVAGGIVASRSSDLKQGTRLRRERQRACLVPRKFCKIF